MKKVASFLFILFAISFCLKDLVIFIFSTDVATSYAIDIEEESSEKNESDTDEKDDLDEWQLNVSENIADTNFNDTNLFSFHSEDCCYTAFLEITPPPPKFI